MRLYKSCNWCTKTINNFFENNNLELYCSLTCKHYYNIDDAIERLLNTATINDSQADIAYECRNLYKYMFESHIGWYAYQRDDISFELLSIYRILQPFIKNNYGVNEILSLYEH